LSLVGPAAPAAAALACVLALMLGELALSRRNERVLLQRGAVEPPDPAYATMRWAYPLVFVAMALEGWYAGRTPGALTLVGILVFTLAKALKYWAIASLGCRWSYRVLVLPGAPLVSSGPYRVLRHPNYVAVVGELAGMALIVGAPIMGSGGTAFFLWLLQMRIRAEERALNIE
jgi:methyltransferase